MNENQFSVVGIGASAGGLKVIQDFFDKIQAPVNATFIIIQHLSPDYKSMMDDLLSDHTSLEIETIQHNQLIKPHHIYLIPPNKNVEIYNDKFVLSEIDRAVPVNYPIDIFFQSLSRNFQERAVGIILSGTGTDGSRGIKAIKEEGGLILVQDPEKSEFDGMPKSAVNTGLVDIVGPVDLIASRLVNFLEIGRLDIQIDGLRLNNEFDHVKTLDAILDQLASRRNIDFKLYKKGTILRRIAKRIQILGLQSLSDYHDYLVREEIEAEILEKEFLIGVTSFFRDNGAFKYLKQKILGQIFKSKPATEEIRIWSVGCATGEEAYSLAILLDEYKKANNLKHSFKIFATDLNDLYLNEAAKGVFNNRLVVDLDKKRLEKYFIFKKDQCHIKKDIRNTIVFANHDILKNPPFINIDLIVCRNVLIYFEKDLQQSLFNRFNYCLSQNGFLFLGLNESVNSDNQNFLVISNKWKIYQNKSVVKELPQNNLFKLNLKRNQVSKKLDSPKNPTKTVFSSDSDIKQYISTLLKYYAPTFILVNDKLDVLHISGEAQKLMRFPRNRLEFNLENMVSRKNLGIFRAGIQRVNEENNSIKFSDIPFLNESDTTHLDLKFIPLWFEDLEEKLFIVELGNQSKKDSKVVKESYDGQRFYDKHVRSLEVKLKDTEQQLDEYIGQFEQTNEELQTSNEELMSSNEEMQSTNEELQAVNEELYSVNSELQSKLVEITDINNDINNLLSSTEIGTIFLDNQLKIRKYTPVIERLFNIQKSDIGRHIYNFTDNFDFDNYRNSLSKVLESRDSIEFEIKNSSNQKYYLMKINPFINHKGSLKGVVISFIDIDETTRIEEEINRWFDLSVDLISISDKDGHFRQLNQRFEELLGWTKDYMFHKPILEFIHADDKKDTKDYLKKLATAPSTHHFENRLITQDGSFRVIAWSCQSTQEGIIYSIGRDITQDKKNYENLKRSHEELEQFAYVATHDLRAPIVNIGSLVNIFETLGYVNDENKELFDKLKLAVSGIHDTLHDLIGIVALRKTIDQSIKKTSIKDLFESVVESIQEQVKMAHADIRTDFSEGEYISYIPGHIKSIIQNLLTNSVKYRSPRRKLKVKVKTSIEDEYVRLTVEDNGKGIDKNHHHHVFKLFKRLDESVEGKGIGLFAIKSQIESNGGKISFESDLDKGCKFTVLLKPMVEMAEEEELA
ncbi:CheR family methyltransferase [Fulvivirgaceae bacterium BMA12]|uniref:CheR family methyltransferase n=1 Tax=Agaribacillus aureus TaxID=3051825 RepID=A0ABT8L5I6_9BACT|nr:CheR family methyltransferase [Fulvivirgaceae bacterium BMA12]